MARQVQPGNAEGQAARPWLTVVLDDHSRAGRGYTVFLGAPTAEQTALALHQGVGRKTVSVRDALADPPAGRLLAGAPTGKLGA